MDERKYRTKFPEIARLLHDTNLTFAEIGRKVGFTTQYVHWVNKRLGQFGRPQKVKAVRIRKNKLADEALERFANGNI